MRKLFVTLILCLPLIIFGENANKNNTPEIFPLYYFNHAPFVNPRIIQDLGIWLSDSDDQVVEINLLGSQDSNRYFIDTGKLQIRNIDSSSYPLVGTGGFDYQLIGKLSTGAFVLKTLDGSGGGTGVFTDLMVLKFAWDIDVNGKKRLLIKKLGEINLCDRWDGTVRIVANKIIVYTKQCVVNLVNQQQTYTISNSDGLNNNFYKGGLFTLK